MSTARIASRPPTPEPAPAWRSAEPLGLPPATPDVMRLHRARCACRRCGAHTFTNVGFTIGGSCPNCGSFELVPVEGG